jgi:D-sedoheptulose 7-phosphate isomerase
MFKPTVVGTHRPAESAANEPLVTTIARLVRDGGALREVCDDVVIVPSHTTARIREAHIFVGHLWCGLVEQQLGPPG